MNLIFRRTDIIIPGLLIAAGILLRLEYLREYAALINFDIPAGPDVMEYDLRAREILRGRFFPVSPDIHAPLYPLVLALLYLIGNLPFIRFFQLGINFFCWLSLTRLLHFQGVPFRTRMIFLGCAMLYPVPFFHQAELISEALLLPFFTAALWLLQLAESEFDLRKRLLRMAGGGCAAGLAAIVHPLSLAFAAGVCICWFFRKFRREAAVFAAGVLLVVLPTVGIKSMHYGKVVGIQQNGGFNIWLGNNPDATGGCYMRPGPHWRKLHDTAGKEAAARKVSADRIWLERSVKFWLQNPAEGCLLYLKKALMVLAPAELVAGADPGELVYASRIIRYGSWLLPLLIYFALCGAGKMWVKREFTLLPLWVLAGSLYAAQIFTVTSGRYRLAMLPALFFFASCGLADFKWKKYFYLPVLVLAVSFPALYAAFSSGRYEAAAIRGECAIFKGDVPRAVRELEFAKQGCFDPARISNQLGMLYEKTGNFSGAEKEYSEGVKGDPDSMESYMNLANLYSRFPRSRKAAETFYRMARERAENSPLLHYNYAVYLKQEKRHKEAEKELLLALECDPGYHAAYNLLGITALEQGRRDVAEHCFRTAFELAPEQTGYRRNLEFVRNGNRFPANK